MSFFDALSPNSWYFFSLCGRKRIYSNKLKRIDQSWSSLLILVQCRLTYENLRAAGIHLMVCPALEEDQGEGGR